MIWLIYFIYHKKNKKQTKPKIKLKNHKKLSDRDSYVSWQQLFWLTFPNIHPSFSSSSLLHLLRRLVEFRKDFDTMETKTELLDQLQHPGKRTWGWSEHMSNSVQSVSARTQDVRPYTAFPRFLGKQSKSFWWNIDWWWCKIVQFYGENSKTWLSVRLFLYYWPIKKQTTVWL